MNKSIRHITIAALAMALLPGVWNILIAIVLTLTSPKSIGDSFFQALWFKFNNFGSVESFLADIVFFIVALWQGYRLAKLAGDNRAKAKQLVIAASVLAAILHLAMHVSMGFFLLGDIRIALSIILGALIGLFFRNHHQAGHHESMKADRAT